MQGDRVSVVGTATWQGLYGPGVEPGGKEVFRTRSPHLEVHRASYTGGTGLPFQGKSGRGMMLKTRPLIARG